MKHFRRSTKGSDRSSEIRPGHTSIPAKSDFAIAPPKKVIKALYDYQNTDNDPNYLSFNTGDFLHVVGRETDPDWYEACNPIIGTRGLVPVNYFELVGKQGRASGGIDTITANTAQQLGNMTLVDRSVAASRQSVQNQQGPSNGHTSMNGSSSASEGLRMSKLGRTSGAMVYGVVQYDFHAERPDELEAKAGEAIIVIAQSNPEWFVAKPITRLGGPGLIPVSFIEIRDMTSGTAVTDPHEAVQKAGVPKVEEWKRMAASYKNSSIPLGKLGSSQENSQRVSVDSHMNGSGYERVSNNYSANDRQSQQSYSSLPSPFKARVPRYCHHEMKFWFIVEAFMDNGKSWELNREYTDFYALQTALMEAFPQEAGKVEGHKRTLPFMPGPLPWVTERLTSERRDHMDRYLLSLLTLPSHITGHPVVRQFFAPRESDTEIEGVPESEPEMARLSQGSSQQSFAPQDSRQSSTGNLSYSGTNFTSPSKSSQQHYQAQSPTGYGPGGSHQRGPSGANGQGMYGVSSGAGGSGSLAQIASGSSAPKAQVKIKAYFGGTDVVVLRLDEDFDYSKLVEKVRDRWPNPESANNLIIDYKSDRDGQFYPLSDDSGYSEDQLLQKAQSENDKLVIRVTSEDAY